MPSRTPLEPRAAAFCLLASVVAMCWGLAAHSLRGGDPVFSYLFIDRGWTEASAWRLTSAIAWGLVVASVVLPWRRAWPVLLGLAVWVLVLMVAAMHQRPPQAELMPGSWAVRYLAPLGLVLLRGGRENTAVVLLQLAAAATFLCHGLEALAFKAEFQDLIFMGGSRLFGAEPSPGFTEDALVVIGVLDLIAVVLVLAPVRRWRMGAAVYMACWGLITAVSRTLHSGWDGVDDTLMRVPNGGVPLALWLCWRHAARRGAPWE